MEQESDDSAKTPRGRRSGKGAEPAGSSGPAGGKDAAAGPAGEGPSTPMTQQIGRVVVVLLLVVFGVFAATNAQPVDFSWVFGSTEVVDGPGEATEGGVPLIVLLLGSFAVGALAGAGLVWQARRRGRPSGQETSQRRSR
jgi:uncharacterized integral membrane protein